MSETALRATREGVDLTDARLTRHAAALPHIVVVHDDAAAAAALKDLIEFMDAPEVSIARPQNWAASLGKNRLAALFLSQSLASKTIAAAFTDVAKIDRNAAIVLFGGAATNSDAKHAWARVLHLANPLQLDELSNVLEEVRALHSRRRTADAGLGSQLIGDSADMRMIRALIERVAPSQATVLVTGESGTGKELIARQIHEQSGLKGEFVAINCGAIPDHLLESELFGHEKGAFTGAHAARAGRFEQAKGGTLFLDEIGDMPTAMQVKLLRVLQERVVERVGGTKSIPVDIRVVAATHRNLQERIAEGSFREDLFYRLSVFPIEVSALRERPEDIEPLAAALIARVARNYGVRVRLSADAMQILRDYSWPGNVRELANLVERLAVIYPNREVPAAELPGALQNCAPAVISNDLRRTAIDPATELPADGIDLKQHLARLERELIANALREAGGVVQKAAERLGMGRTTLVEKIRRHELRS
ncbi:MAG: sigma-54 dependent transcriptional regulator [Woeseia sp.]